MITGAIDPDSLQEPWRTRVKIWRSTERQCRALTVPPSSKHAYDAAWDVATHRRHARTRVSVSGVDTFVAARTLVERGLRPAVLNLADDSVPGGNVSTGSGAQEESLFRRSSLHRHLPFEMYPLGPRQAIYSPGVVVFREPEAAGYATLKTFFRVDVVTCPGLRHPQIQDGRLSDADALTLADKVRLIFQAAADHGADSLVLGGLGCGAWRNPPAHVAAIFHDVVDEYDGVFKAVVFAILPPGHVDYFEQRAGSGGGPGNLAVFTAEFSGATKRATTPAPSPPAPTPAPSAAPSPAPTPPAPTTAPPPS
jgi:uncharacterized protein (TIGR02452 family)